MSEEGKPPLGYDKACSVENFATVTQRQVKGLQWLPVVVKSQGNLKRAY